MVLLKQAAAMLDVHPVWLCNQLRKGYLVVSTQYASPTGRTEWNFTPEDIVEMNDSTLLKAERLRRQWRAVYKQAMQEAKERRGQQQRPIPPGQRYRPPSR